MERKMANMDKEEIEREGTSPEDLEVAVITLMESLHILFDIVKRQKERTDVLADRIEMLERRAPQILPQIDY